MIAQILLALAVAGISAATIFLLLASVSTWRFRSTGKHGPAGDATQLPASLLKPLHGSEPRLYENLRSFFEVNHPTFELIFGARHKNDPALDVVRRLQAEFPQVATQIVLCGEPDKPNAKVCALERMVEAASHDFLIISDSDVQVRPNYVAEVLAPLQDTEAGLVTCVYRGASGTNWWSRLEALGMSVEMTSGVLIADMLEGMKFALGPTMATRKDVLRQIGGIGVLADYCADDYVLGQLVERSGKQVVLSRHVIDHHVLNTSMWQSLLHQARWMKSARYSRPLGHIGTGLTFAVPSGLLGMAAAFMARSPRLGLALLALAVGNRVLQALVVGWGGVRDRAALLYCWLYPVRDLLGFFIWCSSFLDSVVVWRGERYLLCDGGFMTPVSQRLPRRARAVNMEG